jgi:hypothetical protein
MGLITRIKRKFMGQKVPKKSKKELEKKGGDKIVGMFIVRRPIESYVNKLLQVATLGQIDKAVKEAGVRDKILHLFLVINGYIYELNEELSLGRKQYSKKEGDELIRIEPTPDLTIQELLQKAQDTMGSKYTDYNPFKNNCGQWVAGVLRSNGIMKQEYTNFINQNVGQIAKKLGWTSTVVEAITDAGALVAEIKDVFD